MPQLSSQYRKILIGISWIPVALALSDVYHVSKIDGRSMQPVLNPNDNSYRDWVLVKIFNPRANLSRNDIVLLKSPFDPAKILCKRIKAMPLETIKYSPPSLEASNSQDDNDDSMLIPRGHVWVEGDNIHSIDSRKFGPVSDGLIVGKVMCIIWPPNRWTTDLNRWIGNNIVIDD